MGMIFGKRAVMTDIKSISPGTFGQFRGTLTTDARGVAINNVKVPPARVLTLAVPVETGGSEVRTFRLTGRDLDAFDDGLTVTLKAAPEIRALGPAASGGYPLFSLNVESVVSVESSAKK